MRRHRATRSEIERSDSMQSRTTGSGSRAATLIAATLVAATVTAPPSAAGASPLFELVGDVSGDGGLVARHAGPGAGSTYFNPALLLYAEERAEAGFLLLYDAIDLDVAPRADAQSLVPTSAAGAFHGEGDLRPVAPPPIPSEWLERGCAEDCEQALVDDPLLPRPHQAAPETRELRSYAALGLVDRLAEEVLVFGLYLLVPLESLTRATSFYNDEREQYFTNSVHPELYADRLEAMSVAFGFGSRPIERLSVGVSFTLAFDNVADASTFAPDASRYEELRIHNDVRAKQALTPHFGVALEPVDDLVLTATLHTGQSLGIEAAFSSFLPDGSDQHAVRRFRHHHQPWSAAAGAEYRLRLRAWHTFAIAAGATFTRWSDYRDRHDEQPSGAYAWSDTLSPSLGLRHAWGNTDARLDVTWFPSPAPEQTGRSNYVDNDRVGLAGGVHYRFTLFGARLRAGAQAQAHRLVAREHEKRIPPAGYAGDDLVLDEVPDDAVERLGTSTPVDPRDGLQTNNPGFPGFSSEGWIFAGGASLALLF